MADIKDLITEATEGSRELDALIGIARRTGSTCSLGSRPGWIKDAAGEYEAPHYTTSLDAALTLVPEGWRAGFEDGGKYDGVILPEAWCWPLESSFEPDWQNGHEGYRSAPDGHKASAKTRSLAVCIAALHARKSFNG